jgi:uncharacterized protein YjdB
MDKPTYYGNFKESSGSGMFVYALKKGMDNGWISSATYSTVVQKGWTGMQTQIATYTDGKPQIRNFCPAMEVQNNTASYIKTPVHCPASSGIQHPQGYCGILMAASAMEFPSVNVSVTGVSVSPTTVALSVGSAQQLTATISPSNAANNYGCRVSGYLCAPLTGSYTFWIAGDDNVELWLSIDNTETNKVKIAYPNGYTSSRQ